MLATAAAHGDLDIARAVVGDDAPARGTAFFAQQALEKALKSILVWEQIDFPRTHDLTLLARLVPLGWDLDLPRIELIRLNDFPVETRYPIDEWSDVHPVRDAEAAAALAAVTAWVRDITNKLAERGLGIPTKSE